MGQRWEVASQGHEYHLITKVNMRSSIPHLPELQKYESTYVVVDIFDYWTMEYLTTYGVNQVIYRCTECLLSPEYDDSLEAHQNWLSRLSNSHEMQNQVNGTVTEEHTVA
ncbi:Uncharacterized protein Fot_09640 [Forsythia ovata]|uniref:Uncharacterized protein n=1 Tax=Forsythia ovata TaxID=205694 RepID=A0ABD1WFA0_9LAMI